MLTKYTISGLVKPKEEQEQHCSVCRDGKIFEGTTNTEFKVDCLSNDGKEYICSPCLTKYKTPRIQIPFLVDSGGQTITEHDIIDYETKDKLLTKDNALFFLLKFWYNNQMEAKKMNAKELLNKREFLEEMGSCPGHMWNNTQPFKTSEGKFVIQTCLVCGLSKINYNGKNYEDKLSNIVNYLSAKGIEFENKVKEGDLFAEIEIEKDKKIDVANLFDETNLFDDISLF